MSDILKLPRWAQDRIAALEAELRHWQDLYVRLAESRDPRIGRPIPPPADIKIFPPGTVPTFEPQLPPGVYAYMCPFPSDDLASWRSGDVTSQDIMLPGPTSRTPTSREP